MPAQGLDMLLLAARYIEEFGNSSSDAPDHSENPTSCAEKAENAIHVVTPCEGSPGYTSMSLSQPTSQLTEIANKHFPSECPSSASSPPSSPCPSSVDSDYTMSFQSSKSVSSRECSPEVCPRNVTKFPKKAAHKSSKTALVGGKVFNIPIMTRDMMWRMSVLRTANSIETTPNSPVKETSRQLLEKVYDDVTSHPPKFWEQLIAARVLDRTPAQVRVWFSNRRQWYPSGTTIQVPLLDRDSAYPRRRTVKLRPSALEMSQEWSDSFFDDVLALYMGEQVQDTLKEECEHKRKMIPRYKGKSKKGQVKSK